jgi:hypothetical protein
VHTAPTATTIVAATSATITIIATTITIEATDKKLKLSGNV